MKKKKKRIEKSKCCTSIDELMTMLKKKDVRIGRYHIQNCEIEVDSVHYRVSDVDIDVFVSKTGELRIEIPNVECEMFQMKNMEIFVEESIRIRMDTLCGTFPLSSLPSVRLEIAKFENELYTIESLHADLSSKSNNIKAKHVVTSLSFDRFSSSFWQPNLTTMRSTRVRIETFSSRITIVSSQIQYLLLTCQDLNFHFDKEETKLLRLRMSKIRCESIQLFAITNTHQKIQIARISDLEFDGGLHESVPSSSTSITPATSKTSSSIVTRTRSNFSMLTAFFYKRLRRNTVLNTLNIAFGDAWKKRFFTLSRFALSYYDTSDSPYPLGRIDMKENIHARFIKDSLLEFEIVSKESSGRRLLHVRAQSTVEAKRWIHEINCRSQDCSTSVRRVNRNVSDDDDTMESPENGVTLRHISLKCRDVELYVSVKELYEFLFSFANKTVSVIDLMSQFFERSFFCQFTAKIQGLRVMIRRTVHDSKIAMRLETRLVRAEKHKKIWRTKVSDVTLSYFNDSNFTWEPVLHLKSSNLTAEMSDIHIQCLDCVTLNLTFQFLSMLRSFQFDSEKIFVLSVGDEKIGSEEE
eukprot:g4056.t1